MPVGNDYAYMLQTVYALCWSIFTCLRVFGSHDAWNGWENDIVGVHAFQSVEFDLIHYSQLWNKTSWSAQLVSLEHELGEDKGVLNIAGWMTQSLPIRSRGTLQSAATLLLSEKKFLFPVFFSQLTYFISDFISTHLFLLIRVLPICFRFRLIRIYKWPIFLNHYHSSLYISISLYCKKHKHYGYCFRISSAYTCLHTYKSCARDVCAKELIIDNPFRPRVQGRKG